MGPIIEYNFPSGIFIKAQFDDTIHHRNYIDPRFLLLSLGFKLWTMRGATASPRGLPPPGDGKDGAPAPLERQVMKRSERTNRAFGPNSLNLPQFGWLRQSSAVR